MVTITFKVRDADGSLTDADSVPVLSDKTEAYGIKRNDTGVAVVADGTAMTKSATGTYTYEFDPPATLVPYTAWVEVVYKRKTSFYEILFTPPAPVSEPAEPATPVITFKVRDADGDLADADSVPVLCDKGETYGIKRTDIGTVVVSANTAMTKTDVGIYTYDFTPPDGAMPYTIWIKVTYDDHVSYYEVLYTPPFDVSVDSTPTITFKVRDVDGNLMDADSVPVLSDKTGTYGIKRDDNDAVVIAADIAMTKTGTGTYAYEFDPPITSITYTAWIKVVCNGNTSYYEVVYSPATESFTFLTTADILWSFLIEETEIFTDPSDNDSWPLYNDSLPDDSEIEDDIAAVFSTAGVVHGKDVSGIQHTHHGIQLRVRALDKRDAAEKAHNATTVLIGGYNRNITIGDNTYTLHNITQTTDVIPINIDEKNRTHYTVNFIVAYTKL